MHYRLTLAIMAVILALAVFPLSTQAEVASIPILINHQGFLTDTAGIPLTGAYDFQFDLFVTAAGGFANWTESVLNLPVQAGRYTHQLGSLVPLSQNFFIGLEPLYLQVTVEGQIITPRTLLTSSPYSLAANEIEVNSTFFPGNAVLRSDNFNNGIYTLGDNANATTWLYGYDWGVLNMYDKSGGELTVEMTASNNEGGRLLLNQQDGTSGMGLYGGNTSFGSLLEMRNAAGGSTISFSAQDTGNASATLPASSVSATEMLNEPGISANNNSLLITLNDTAMIDLLTTTITIPAAGYVVVEGKCYLEFSGTTGANQAFVQIDTIAGGNAIFPYYAFAGLGAYVSTVACWFPAYVTRVYFFNQAGTHTFRMEGRRGSASPAFSRSWDHIMTAEYFPTSYGAVSTVVAQADGFSQVTPVALTNSDDPSRSGLSYVVDLRELELKAAKEQAEAEKAQRELLEAKLAAAREESQQTRRGPQK